VGAVRDYEDVFCGWPCWHWCVGERPSLEGLESAFEQVAEVDAWGMEGHGCRGTISGAGGCCAAPVILARPSGSMAGS